jgi:hypothetical protein
MRKSTALPLMAIEIALLCTSMEEFARSALHLPTMLSAGTLRSTHGHRMTCARARARRLPPRLEPSLQLFKTTLSSIHLTRRLKTGPGPQGGR